MTWIDDAIDELRSRRREDGAWAYRLGGGAATEPTALAVMALSAHGQDAAAGLDWLVATQRADGGLPPIAGVDESNWVTALGANALLAAGRTHAGETAVDWLLGEPSFSLPRSPASPYGYDTSLTAWPWTSGDYSWVEPTAFAMIALSQSSKAGHAKGRQGEQLLLDRQTRSGGWNYGEPKVLNADLPPAVLPTALAVLALLGTQADLAAPIAVLQDQRDSQTSLLSLAWAGIAMAGAGQMDEAWRTAIASRWAASSPGPRDEDGGLLAALALLAVAEPTNNPLTGA